MEAVTQLAASPLDGGGPLLEPSLEVVGGVADVEGLPSNAPFHVIRDMGRDLLGSPAEQRVLDGEVVVEAQVVDLQRCLAVVEVRVDGISGKCRGPEEATRVYPWVEIVNLVNEVALRVDRLVDIQSNEAKGAVMVLPVGPHKEALEEAGVEVERLRSAAVVTHAAERGQPDHAVEVGD